MDQTSNEVEAEISFDNEYDDNNTSGNELYKRHFLRQHDAMWGQATWPEGTVLASADSNGRYKALGSVPILDVDAAWAILEPAAAKKHTTYITLNPRATAPATGSTGKSDSVELLAGLFVDIDVAEEGTEHAMGDRNPDRLTAASWRTKGLPATVVNSTGGGSHIYFALAEPLDAKSDIARELLARHRAFWVGIAEADGKNIDVGPLANIAQMPRPSGTWNAKQGKPVRLFAARRDARYTIEEFFAVYPAVDMTPRYGSANRTAPTHDGVRRILDPDASIGDRFAVNMPVGQFAYSVFNTETNEQGGVTFPRFDGSLSRESNSKLYDDGEVGEQRLTIFGARVMDAFGLEGQNNSMTSWDLLGRILGGNFKRAAQILALTEDDGEWDDALFDAAINTMDANIAEAFGVDQDPDYFLPAGPAWEPATASAPAVQSITSVLPAAEVASMVPLNTASTDYGVQIADGEGFSTPGLADLLARVESLSTEVETPKLTVVDALLNRTPARFDLGNTKTVFLNGEQGRHGIYRRSVDSDSKQESFVALTNWVLLKIKNVESRTVGDDGSELASTDVKVTLAFSGANGYMKVMPGFTLQQSHNIQTAIDMLNVDVMLPERDSDTRSVTNVVRVLASEGGGGERTSQYGSLGWMKSEKGWVYLAPAGSVNANGSTQECSVGAPPNSEEGALNDLQLSYGWAETPDTDAEIREAAKSIREYLNITPTKPAAYAALGLLLAAPLAYDRRTTVFLAGPPDNGKSLCSGGAQAFLTGISTSSNWTGGPLAKGSAFAASIVTAWARHGVSIWDDYRVDTQNHLEAAKMHTTVSTILQAAYGNAGVGPKGTQAGGLKAVRSSSSAAIVTGEGLPEEGGVVSRAVTIHIGMGDVAMTPMFHSQYDRFANDYAKSAHLTYAAYLRFLARRLDAHKTIASFRAANGRLRSELAVGDGRSVEGVSFISAGWAMFAEFAAEVGISQDLFPDAEERQKIAIELSGSNDALVGESNPSLRIVKTARDMLAGGAGHIVRLDGFDPTGVESPILGWSKIDSYNGPMLRACGLKLGTLSSDNQWVILNENAVSVIARRVSLDSMPKDQMKGGFVSIVMPGTTPGDKTPRSLSGDARLRGYALPASMFDINLPDPTKKDTLSAAA